MQLQSSWESFLPLTGRTLKALQCKLFLLWADSSSCKLLARLIMRHFWHSACTKQRPLVKGAGAVLTAAKIRFTLIFALLRTVDLSYN